MLASTAKALGTDWYPQQTENIREDHHPKKNLKQPAIKLANPHIDFGGTLSVMVVG
jgi:hypothetical protein